VNENDFDGFQQSAELLEGAVSQILLLKDALDTGEDAAVVKAFAVVSRICGLDWLAVQAGYNRSQLFAALADHQRPDINVLNEVVARLLKRCDLSSEDCDF
jgi:DNA-binding phage protein